MIDTPHVFTFSLDQNGFGNVHMDGIVLRGVTGISIDAQADHPTRVTVSFLAAVKGSGASVKVAGWHPALTAGPSN